MMSLKTMLRKLGATGPNFCSVIGMKFLLIYQILCHSDKRIMRYKLQRFGDFSIYCMAKWAGRHKLSFNMAATM